MKLLNNILKNYNLKKIILFLFSTLKKQKKQKKKKIFLINNVWDIKILSILS